MDIHSLNGLFDGYKFHPGPVTISIDRETITSITYGSSKGDFDGSGLIASVPFTDAHTHALFAGNRFNELDKKISGLSYIDILNQGGGIPYTMQQTRNASDETLIELLSNRLDCMLERGTMHVEVKTGYGLDHWEEIRHLKILNKLNDNHPINITITYGGPHIPPPGRERNEYLSEIIEETVPYIKKKNLASSVDIFCDRGAFSIQESKLIMAAAREYRLPIRVHAEELEYTGIGQIASSEYQAISVDHLLKATSDDFRVFASNGTVATFMPLAPIGLFSNDIPKGWKNSGVTIALGSDFNPNNWVLSMQLAIQMAVYRYRMHPIDAYIAGTSGSYQSLNGIQMEKMDIGTLANLILIEGSSIDEICAKIGQNNIRYIIKAGNIIFENVNKIA